MNESAISQQTNLENEEEKKKKEIEELEKQIAEAQSMQTQQPVSAIPTATKPTPGQKEEPTAGLSEEDMCPEHQRKLEIICISDRSRICSNCALFGAHKGHDIRMEAEVVNEIT